MILTRRSLLVLGAAALATPALIRPADAKQCRFPDINRGVLFKREDGTRGLARRQLDGSVVIDYVTNKGDRVDRRRVEHGVFETWRLLSDSEQPVVGSAPPEWAWSYSRKAVPPEPGKGWSGRVKEVRTDIGYGDYMKEIVTKSRSTWDAKFRFLEGKEVRLSGCVFSMIPVEATFTGKQGRHRRRWVYFPQLDLGVETRRDGVSNGVVALQAV